MPKYVILTLIVLLALISACTGGDDDTPEATVAITDEPTAEVSAATEDPTEEVLPTEDPTPTEEVDATEETAATEDIAATEEPGATEELTGTEETAATEDVSAATTAEVPVISLTQEVGPHQSTGELILIDPTTGATMLPPAAPAYSIIALRLNTDAISEDLGSAPSGQRWAILNAIMANEAGDVIQVTPEQLILIDEDGTRYTAEPSSDLVQPNLAEMTLAQGQSMNGFALFAIPQESTPSTVIWCLDAACEDTLQTDIN